MPKTIFICSLPFHPLPVFLDVCFVLCSRLLSHIRRDISFLPFSSSRRILKLNTRNEKVCRSHNSPWKFRKLGRRGELFNTDRNSSKVSCPFLWSVEAASLFLIGWISMKLCESKVNQQKPLKWVIKTLHTYHLWREVQKRTFLFKLYSHREVGNEMNSGEI